ncbi:MAG: putative ABC transporter permease [Oscillibacter sp.]|nr:putative ABC transporter permease [Oscillibacter sp.]MCI8847991.1 putative ABC transporter permease [Oscillibacter sp.]
MHIYTTGQWALLFFFYCFCGWIWESSYVSVRQRQWVNRGFLQGPLLPIYGSGAIIILLATIPVENDLRLVYLFGMTAATALEYVTGAVMERLFRVRYWDYSSQRWNLNGHICLSSSIAWGFFSILMVRFIHPPIARLLLRVPAWCVDPLALALTAVFTVDAVRSVQAALDLRETLARLAEENEALRRLAKRAEVYAAFANDDLQRFRERTEVEKRLLQQRVGAELAEQRQARAERRAERRARAEAVAGRYTAAKLDVLETVADALATCRNHLDSLPDMTPEKLEARRAELDEIIRHVQERQAILRSRPANVYHRSLRILRGNPTATVREDFKEALETLRKLK